MPGGFSVKLDQEGVDALRQLSGALLQELDNIAKVEDDLKNTYQEVRATVAHQSDIDEILEEVDSISAGTVTAVASLSSKVAFLASKIEDFISSGLGGSGN